MSSRALSSLHTARRAIIARSDDEGAVVIQVLRRRDPNGSVSGAVGGAAAPGCTQEPPRSDSRDWRGN